jgi:hypothetical protein
MMMRMAEIRQGAITAAERGVRRTVDYFRSTPRLTFVVYPLAVLLAELIGRRGRLRLNLANVPFMLWGYLQYRLAGAYRQRQGAGSRGFGGGNMPQRLLQTGPYAYTRNPMYLGHLIFLFSLGSTFHSKVGNMLFVANALWFHRRVLRDEALLREKFGGEYDAYAARVKRWVPFVF